MTTSDPTALVAEARALLARAAPGPWRLEWTDTQTLTALDAHGAMVTDWGYAIHGHEQAEILAEAYDERLIAAAPGLIAELCDALDRARAERGELLAAADKISAERDGALRTLDEHRCDDSAEGAYARVLGLREDLARVTAERDAARAAIERVRELHPRDIDDYCQRCATEEHPCATVRALDDTEAGETR